VVWGFGGGLAPTWGRLYGVNTIHRKWEQDRDGKREQKLPTENA